VTMNNPINMKTKSLHCLQELIDEVKWIDDKISNVDFHISRLYHIVENTMAEMPSIFACKERTIIVEGGPYCYCYYHYYFFSK